MLAKQRFKQWYTLLMVAMLTSFASLVIADDGATVQMNMHDFMKQYIKPAGKLAKKGNEEPVLRIYQILPSLALAEDKDQWQAAIDKAVEAGKPNSGCRGCHKANKRAYAKKNGDRLIAIPAELIAYLEQAQR